jgi:adenylate kinase
MAARVIFIMGPQGSGKGTQSDLLATKIGGVHLSSGQMMRDGTDEAVKDRIAGGNLAKTADFLHVMDEGIDRIPAETPIVFDGVGRMLPEAEWLESKLAGAGRPIARVIFLKAPRDESVSRMQVRRHKEGRTDDSLEAINRRLDLYDQETLPVHDFWKKHGLLSEVDGVGSVEEVAKRIDEALA